MLCEGITSKTRSRCDSLWIKREAKPIIAITMDDAGFYEEASNILRMALDVEKTTLRLKDSEVYPLIYYYLGYFLEKMGSYEEAFKFYRLGGKARRDYIFPFRLETLNVLKQVIRRFTRDARARYYLGNLLFSIYRFEEAMKEWNISADIDPEFDVIHRNLGLAYWKVKGDIECAVNITRKPFHAILIMSDFTSSWMIFTKRR